MTFETWLRSDLTKPLKVETLHGVFFTADDAANVIGVEVYDGGAAAALSGSCVGYVIRADGGTLIITGTISGNRASITLPASAYVVEGPVDIVIKVVNGSVKTTVGACRGYVVRSTTDVIIDPGHVIPSIEELLAQIEACEQATAAANAAAANANTKAARADTAAAGANAAAGNANTAKDRANAAASALENMDATASGLAEGAAPTATVSTINDHYRIAFGIPKGDKGDTGDTGAAATITNTATAYQNSTSGTTIPTGAWLDTQPDTPQGQFLWIRTVLTWNNGQTTTMYSVSRMGVDGSGSVVSVNNINPDANGNVSLPIDASPTQGSQNPVTSGGTYAALADKQDTLTFDSSPTSGSTNPVTSGGVYSSEQNIRNIVAIVATGNTAPQAITSGQYVIWQNALYTATANIPSGGTLSTSNLQAVAGGGLNALKSSVDTLNSNITKLLWTNEDPSISFAGQNVEISTTGFSYFIVIFRRVSSLAQNISTVAFLGQNVACAFPNDGNANYAHARSFTIYTTYIAFNNGYLNGSVDNSRLIPYQIYGCK